MTEADQALPTELEEDSLSPEGSPPPEESPPAEEISPVAELAIETQALSVFYGRRRGIDRLNLAVRRGEVFGFLGPNGAGKTTTLRVLLDIIRPTVGRATIFGLDSRRDGVAIRRRVGYIPGELSLYPNLTPSEFFRMVAAIRGDRSDLAYRNELLERLDLDPGLPMRTYSRGNKQKVGLVAAFMGRPDLLLLDEPTTGLDPLIQQQVLALVREARAEGRTVFFSSHNLPEVQAVCDRVGMVRSGRLIATETVADLVRGQYHRLRLRFEHLPPTSVLEEAGAREVGRTDLDVTIEVRGSLNAVLSRAVEYGVLDLDDHPFTLDDVFLAYYGAGTIDPYA